MDINEKKQYVMGWMRGDAIRPAEGDRPSRNVNRLDSSRRLTWRPARMKQQNAGQIKAR
jgi:hypothetical protein